MKFQLQSQERFVRLEAMNDSMAQRIKGMQMPRRLGIWMARRMWWVHSEKKALDSLVQGRNDVRVPMRCAHHPMGEKGVPMTLCPKCLDQRKLKGMKDAMCVVCALRAHMDIGRPVIDDKGTCHIDLAHPRTGAGLSEQNSGDSAD